MVKIQLLKLFRQQKFSAVMIAIRWASFRVVVPKMICAQSSVYTSVTTQRFNFSNHVTEHSHSLFYVYVLRTRKL